MEGASFFALMCLGIGFLFFEQAAACLHTVVMEPSDAIDVSLGGLLALAFSILGATGTWFAWVALTR